MPSFEVIVNPHTRHTIASPDDKAIHEVVQRLLLRNTLPERDAYGRPIRYTLMRLVEAGRLAPLALSATLAESGVCDGEELYLANPDEPWSASGRVTPPTPLNPPSLPERVPPLSLQLASDCRVSLTESTIELSRDLLVKHLPEATLRWEEFKIAFGLGSQLTQVGRRRHCTLLCLQGRWWVRPSVLIYLNQRAIAPGGEEALPEQGATLRLGRQGWTVGVQLEHL